MRRLALAGLCAALGSCARGGAPAPAPGPRALDDFESLAAWKAEGSDGVMARVHHTDGVDGRAMQLDFDFQGHGGYAIARRALPLDLPGSYEITFDLRGDAPANNLEVKLVDETGKNVWWFRRPDFAFPAAWSPMRVKKRQIEFAWGPTKDHVLRRAAAIELVVSAGHGGGRGSIAFDRLAIREVPPPPATPPPPIATASSAAASSPAALAVDGRPDTAWRSDAGGEQSVTVDLGYPREFGAITVRWLRGGHASRYELELSRDGRTWQLARRVTDGNGGRDPLLLPESEARYARLLLHGQERPYGVAELEIEDLATGASPNAFIAAIAAESPRGRFPRGFSGQQSYWTIVGVEGASQSGLLSEDGALELGKGGVSVEPFIVSGDEISSWADVDIEQSLADGYLPVPSVTWRERDEHRWELRVTALADGAPDQARLAARYQVENRSPRALDLELVLAIRPFQVNPPTQFLNITGGVSPIRELAWDGAALAVNGAASVHLLDPPDHVGLASFDGGGFPDAPAPSRKPAPVRLVDPDGMASAALVYDLHLAPGERVEVGLVSPLTGRIDPGPATNDLPARQAAVESAWREKLGRVSFTVPADGRVLVDTLRSSLAQILMTREGPALKPGSRSYDRSWIRDGAMISESLLRLGHEATAADYLRWYAPHQFDSGKVPCCVDARGADPVPENDSAGELIFLAAEVYRFTGDRALLESMWPHVDAAARYLEKQRQSERTPANQTAARRPRYGLLPPSISHEGYSAAPAYSYWDDFWGLIGFQDAVAIAEALGRRGDAARLVGQRDQFRADLHASVAATAALHHIDYIPGAADLGDFDATSTTIALAPGREGPTLPRALVHGTFERYWKESVARRDGTRLWDAYTPYELRVVGTFIRLGWRDRAGQMLAFFAAHRRPAAWNQWAEVVGRDPRQPRFIGDMPHAWVASDYIRSALDMFAYARDADRALVLAAGVPVAWFDAGFAIDRLRTPYGQIGYTVTRTRRHVVIEVSAAKAPPGGFALPWAWEGSPGRATVNGARVAWKDGELRFTAVPARVEIERRRTSGAPASGSQP